MRLSKPLFVAALSLLPAAASSAQLSPAPRPFQPVETSVSLGVAAQLTATRVAALSNTAPSQGFDPSAAVLGSVRQSFRPWLGYTVNLGYTRSTEENYDVQSYSKPFSFPIPVNIYETTLTYHLQKRLSPRLTGSADLGGGALSFLPVHRGPTAVLFVPGLNHALIPSYLARPTGVATVGVDFHLTPRLALRAEYRGLLYKFPDFGGTVGRALTETSQPTVSLTYTFGHGHP